MAKIDIEKLKHILHRNENDIQKINDILNDIATELQIEEAEKLVAVYIKKMEIGDKEPSTFN